MQQSNIQVSYMHTNTLAHEYIPTEKCALMYALTSLPGHIHMHTLSHTKIEPPYTHAHAN